MFHGKFVIVIKVQPITEIKIVTTYVNVVDVNVTTRSKETENMLRIESQGKQRVLLIRKKKNN
jgi:hypothetical protein